MQKTAKILATNSSPKRHGHTARFLEHFIKLAEKIGTEIVRRDLYQEPFHLFSGRLNRTIKHLNHLQHLMCTCDGFVIATPTHWFNEPGVLKNFLDPMTPLEENGFRLEGKFGTFIVDSPQGGEAPVLQNFVMVFNHMGVVIPPYSMIFYHGKQDTWVAQDIKDLANRMLVQIQAQKQLGLKWDKW